MANKIQIMVELEKRGKLPEGKKQLLAEARRRGLVDKDAGAFDKGGWADRNLLSGQLPMAGYVGGAVLGGMAGLPAGGGLGSPVTAPLFGVAGAGLGGAGGQVAEDAIRQALGWHKPKGMRETIGRAAQTGSASMAAEALPVGQAMKIAGRFGAKNYVKPLQQRLATSAFPTPTKEIAGNIVKGELTLGQEAAKRGVYGMKRNVLNRVVRDKKLVGQQLDTVLNEASQASIDPHKIMQSLQPVRQKLTRLNDLKGLKLLERKEAEFLGKHARHEFSYVPTRELIKPNSKILNPMEANIIKRLHADRAKSIYNAQQLGNVDAVAAVEREWSKGVADGLRAEINKIVPEASFLNKEYHIYNELVDVVSNSMAKDLKNGAVMVAHPMSTGGAGALGYAATGDMGGAVTAAMAQKAGRSFPVKSYLATQLDKIVSKKGGETIYADLMAHPTFRKMLFNVLGRSMKMGLVKQYGASRQY